jgi:hypothetical protein
MYAPHDSICVVDRANACHICREKVRVQATRADSRHDYKIDDAVHNELEALYPNRATREEGQSDCTSDDVYIM